MQNLYDVLGVDRKASIKDINASLRQLVRRYNEETANGSRDLTEALKFINYARVTFADAERRAIYDIELAAAEKAAEEAQTKQQEIVPDAVEPQPPQQTVLIEDNPALSLQPIKGSPKAPTLAKPLNKPEINSKIEEIDLDSLIVPIALGTKEMTFVGTAQANPSLGTDLGRVLASTDKTKQRSTAANPALRFAARVIDYGLWGLLLGLVVNYLSTTDMVPSRTAEVLSGPFIAPILITLSWAAVEGLLLIFFPSTPGKYLFDIRVATNVSNPYAHSDPNNLISASFLRAFRVWWNGLACGITPLYLFTMAKANNKLIRSKETSWDFDGDCLVTHGHLGIFNVAVVSTILGGIVWLYTSLWITPLQQAITNGWRYATVGASTTHETWKILKGDMPTYGKEIPPAPAKENRTIELEKIMQSLIDKRNWNSLSTHCQNWAKEDDRNPTAWFCYGKARHELGDHNGAVAALKRAALISPQNDDIRRLMKDASSAEMQKKLLRNRSTGSPQE